MNGESHPSSDAVSLSDELASAGVAGVRIVWADNNGIPRSRTVPLARLADVASRGVGSTPSTDSRRWSSALPASDPVTAADNQLLARQTIHAAARAHGLRVSFAPLVTADGVGNGWHIHSSLWRGDETCSRGTPNPGPKARATSPGCSGISPR